MEELEALVRSHKYVPNRMRTNVRPNEERVSLGKSGRRYLVPGVLSNSVRSGRALELCQEVLERV